MQEKIIVGPAAFLAIFVAAAFSVPPIERMGPFMVGVEYTAAVREQVITGAEVNSVEKLHLLSFYYAPFSFVQSD